MTYLSGKVTDWRYLKPGMKFGTTTLQISSFPYKGFLFLDASKTLFFSSEDGWWEGGDRFGNEGVIPSTLVKVTVILILYYK